ncbi:DUF4399 domain-containing protein [Roseovarius aestuarii]|uniref:DUF4399 domain-containing protein n=1 Tax=Roseovarius aestuarii TaxID=475083 RepID=A0A1X7BW01_9RHOB|nr:DUF4399 domain-containing protein [Roseovarius aestuarii]SMC13827.1 hypothetical protein ROA7745_03687 [Roseovarius aestuarii]
MRITTAALAIITAISGPLIAGETPSAPGAEVYFVNLEDGDTVKGPVKVVFGLSGMGVAPAGTEADNTGHHHLLINRAPFGDGPDDAEMLEYGVYADDNHVHFGKGQTETTVELAPGEHSLQLLLGDLNHAPHADPVMSEVITITVE